jgi:hypothetical protein
MGGLAHAGVPEPAAPTAASGECGCEMPEANTVPEEEVEVLPLHATIEQIDYQSGLLNLDTELGPLEAVAAPADIQDLKVGDAIVVYVIEGEDEGEESFMMPVTL